MKSTFSITSELTNQNGSAKRPIHLILVAFCYWNCQTMKGNLQFGQKASEQKQGFANWKHTGCRSLYAALKPWSVQKQESLLFLSVLQFSFSLLFFCHIGFRNRNFWHWIKTQKVCKQSIYMYMDRQTVVHLEQNSIAWKVRLAINFVTVALWLVTDGRWLLFVFSVSCSFR